MPADSRTAVRAPASMAPDVADVADVAADVTAETAELFALLHPLTPAEWTAPTPADGWTVTDTVTHLHHSDRAALAALEGADLGPFVAAVLDPSSQPVAAPQPLLDMWADTSAAVTAAVTALAGPGVRINWFGPPMSPLAFLVARMMETWAHGQDVADALGVTRDPTPRLRHVCELGVRTFSWSFTVRGLPVPAAAPRVELTADGLPGGAADPVVWTWGEPDAADVVRGPALDFALLVTQRRHRADVAVTAQGTAADQWLDVAQAFAGPPGAGRPPRAASA